MDFPGPGPIALAAAAVGCAIAAAIDYRSHRIPNVLSYSLITLGLVLAFASGGAAGWAGGVLALLLGAALVAGAGLGMGDAKLLLALGLLLGPLHFLGLFSLAIVAGLVLASSAWLLSYNSGESGAFLTRRLPFAVPLAFAAVALPLLSPALAAF